MKWLAISALLLLTTTGCKTYDGLQIDSLLQQALTAAEQRKAEGQTYEAWLIAQHVYAIDPRFPGYQEAFGTEPPEIENRFDRPLMGANETTREPSGAGVLTRILWYVPDRVLDLLDIVSFDVHLGLGLYADVHATRALTVAGGGRTVAGLGWHFNRNLGLQTQSEAAAMVPFLGFQGYSAFKTGTNSKGGSWSVAGLPLPGEDMYRDYQDYWALGGAVTVVCVGADADVHLAQCMDFIAGLVFLDPANDDPGRTRPLDLMNHELDLLQTLSEIAGSKPSLQNYREWKASQAANPASAPPATEPEPADTEPSDANEDEQGGDTPDEGADG